MKHDSLLLGGMIMPHPPVIIPDIETSHQALKTVEAMHRAADYIHCLKPDTIVIISPHAPMFSDYLFLYDGPVLEGNLGQFGAPQCNLSYKQDQVLQQAWIEELKKQGLSGGFLDSQQRSQFKIDSGMDHGVFVPLYFLHEHHVSCPIVAASSSYLAKPEIYNAGKALEKAVARLGRRIVLIASGDQSHKVNQASPYGAVREGQLYDNALCQAIRASDKKEILNIDESLCEKAAECGYRSIVMMLGAMHQCDIKTELLSYEAPYGIGYCVAAVKPIVSSETDFDEKNDVMECVLQTRKELSRQRYENASGPVKIAWLSLKHKLETGNSIQLSDLKQMKQDHPELFSSQAGVFVSLKKWGKLRGCIGTTAPTTGSVAEEIVQNAVSAAIRDPRFDPVSSDEMEELTISVDILQPPRPVASMKELDPAVYGVIVSNGQSSGLLLPDLDGIDTAEEQVRIACQKANIDPDDTLKMQKFKVLRYY